MEPVYVERVIRDQLEEVRQIGCCNMLDRARVIEAAIELGSMELADWIAEDKSRYAAAIFGGVELEEDLV